MNETSREINSIPKTNRLPSSMPIYNAQDETGSLGYKDFYALLSFLKLLGELNHVSRNLTQESLGSLAGKISVVEVERQTSLSIPAVHTDGAKGSVLVIVGQV